MCGRCELQRKLSISGAAQSAAQPEILKQKKPPPVYTGGGFYVLFYNNLPYGINRYVYELTTTTTRLKRESDLLKTGFIYYVYSFLILKVKK